MARCYIGKRHASNAPASLSFNISRFVTPAVPPTGADANELSWSVRTVPRAGCRHQPNRRTKSRRAGVGNLFVCRRVQRHGFAFACKNFASRRGLLVCRGGVRTFAAASCGQTSLACFIGTLAAVPGCMAMLAHRLSLPVTRCLLPSHCVVCAAFFCERQSHHPVKSSPS